MKRLFLIFFLFSLMIFSGCSFDINKRGESEYSETNLSANGRTSNENKGGEHSELLSGYSYSNSQTRSINSGAQGSVNRRFILDEVPFSDTKKSYQNLGALGTKQLIKVSGFDKLFSGDITQKVVGESMFSCQLKKEDFIEGVGYGAPCAWVKYFFDRFSFVFSIADTYPEVKINSGRREIGLPGKEPRFEFSRYKLPENVTFKRFVNTYNWTQKGLCLANSEVSSTFAYGEDNPDYTVYTDDSDFGPHYFNNRKERIPYTGARYQWSKSFGYTINSLLANKKAEAYLLSPIVDVPIFMRDCNRINIGVIFHIEGEPYFYIAKSLDNESLSLSDADGMSTFFIDIQE